MSKILLALVLAGFTPLAPAKTIFETYYRVEKSGKHVGYVVQRLTEETTTKVRSLKGYVLLRQSGKNVHQEFSLSTVAGRASKAEYRSNESGGDLDIKAQMGANGAGQVEVQDLTSKRAAERAQLSSASLISGLLFFSVDLSQLKKNISYTYQAYAEERGRVGRGSLVLMNNDALGEAPVLQIADEFLGQTVENFVSPSGIPLGSRINSQNLVTYWVPDRAAAVGLLEFPEARLKQIFGEVPKGQAHPWTQVPDARADILINKFARPAFDRPPQPPISQPIPTRNS